MTPRRQLADLLRVHGWPEVLAALAACAGEESRALAAAGRVDAWQWVQIASRLRQTAAYLPTPEKGGAP
jgi:hypothetical protein